MGGPCVRRVSQDPNSEPRLEIGELFKQAESTTSRLYALGLSYYQGPVDDDVSKGLSLK